MAARAKETGTPKRAQPLGEAALIDLLFEGFAPPRYVLLPHVRNSTGYSGQIRTADAVALGMWPSDGMALIGFELKSSRSDWLRELAQPAKREEIGKFCDQWIVVAGGPGIVRISELPAGVGLLEAVPKGSRDGLFEAADDVSLRMVVQPVDNPVPESVSRPFLAAAVRRALAQSPHGQEIGRRVKAEVLVRAGKIRQAADEEVRKRMNVFWENHAATRAKRAAPEASQADAESNPPPEVTPA